MQTQQHHETPIEESESFIPNITISTEENKIPEATETDHSEDVPENTSPEPTAKKYSFLGLYFPTDLKELVNEAAKKEDRSASKFATHVFRDYFSHNAQ